MKLFIQRPLGQCNCTNIRVVSISVLFSPTTVALIEFAANTKISLGNDLKNQHSHKY